MWTHAYITYILDTLILFVQITIFKILTYTFLFQYTLLSVEKISVASQRSLLTWLDILTTPCFVETYSKSYWVILNRLNVLPKMYISVPNLIPSPHNSQATFARSILAIL